MPKILIALLLSVCCSVFVQAAELPAKKQTKLGLYVTAEQASAMKSQDNGVLLIDVRTREEVVFLGTPVVSDANIPYMVTGDWERWDEKKKTFKLVPNSGFLVAMDDFVKGKGLTKSSKIIVMCRSGGRSSKAANLMSDAGYTNVYSMTDGYEGDTAKSGEFKGQRVVNGWKNAGLAWTYKLSRDRLIDID